MFFKDSLTLEREVLALKPRKTLGKEEDLEGAEREAAGLGFESFEMVAMVIQGERGAERVGLVGGLARRRGDQKKRARVFVFLIEQYYFSRRHDTIRNDKNDGKLDDRLFVSHLTGQVGRKQYTDAATSHFVVII